MKQHRCAVLGIDQAKVSGWALHSEQLELAAHGIAQNHIQRMNAITMAQRLAADEGLTLVVALEDHGEIPASVGGSTSTILGMGAAAGRWRECLEHLGHPSRRTISLAMSDWRRRTLRVKRPRMKRATAKRMAQECVRQLLRVECSEDEAEAMCIAMACYHHPAVEDLVPADDRGVSWEPALGRYRAKG